MPNEPVSGYQGVENLEAMESAHNYHAFLTRSVSRHAHPTGPMLDFGAGTGTHARALGRDFEVCCIEPDPQLRAALEGDGFRVVADINDLEQGSFDTAYSLNVLEHIEDDVAAARALYDVLRPNGSLILYVPAFNILFSEMDRRVGHFRRYRRSGFVEMMREAGFRVVSCTYVDSLGFLAALAYRWLRGSGALDARAIRLYDCVLFPLSRAVDRLTGRCFGKNLLLVASRD